ncbi:MAG: YihY/virulence factor BrkB family protein [Candidatus Omnitrophica bacterium]|nr:YihY/virulence factor BrkB family protein [Candidatus Omnitrophota bacterium]MBU1925012.1 YihY/virulence factor BrkB family protein [Candidatus Omnitrophota bacterium]
MLPKVINFIKTDIWRIRLKSRSRGKSFLIKQLRVILLALRGFNEDKCQLRASALTYYSLLSIVPIFAMAFGIAKGFGFEKLLQAQVLDKLPGQEEVLKQIIDFAYTLLENTKGGVVAGIGVAVLFWTVIKVLGNIERSFNDIWGIKEARKIGRRLSDYLSVLLICPVLIIVSSSATVFIATQIKFITEKISILGAVSPLIFLLLKLLPYTIIWVLFSFIYAFMPNTKVNLKSAIVAGIVAGSLYEIVQWSYITFQIGAAKYNAIYGSFAALPLFLVWLQISWLIVLFGSEIAFAHQNVEMYEFEPDCLQASYAFKRLLSLRIAHLIVKNFSEGNKPFTITQIAHTLEIPIRLLRELLYELVEGGILSEIKTERDEEKVFQPARDIRTLTIKSVIDALEKKGIDNIPIAQSKDLKALSENLSKAADIFAESSANKLLKEI